VEPLIDVGVLIDMLLLGGFTAYGVVSAFTEY